MPKQKSFSNLFIIVLVVIGLMVIRTLVCNEGTNPPVHTSSGSDPSPDPPPPSPPP